jgi:predicted acyltransferase
MKTTENSTRLASLDVFRGVTIAMMILVNDPGDWTVAYPQLKHAAWSGWTMTDMVFPFFLWIMGMAMTLSLGKRMHQGASTKALILHALKRAAIIFALGIVVNGFPFGLGAPFSFATIRIPGVLQRIAICYFVASVLFLKTKPRTQFITALGLLVVYWAAVKLIPVPGYGPGVMDPVGCLCWYVDSHLLAGHTWVWAPAPGFDPEGIVSTLPSIATALFGVMTGRFLRSERSKEVKTAQMFVAGWVMVLAGVVADIWLPINKNCWTSSFSVFMGGLALVCFATVYWLMDVQHKARWLEPFKAFGLNAITLYVVSELLATLLGVITVAQADGRAQSLHDWIYAGVFVPYFSPANASLAFGLVYVALHFALGTMMWKKGWIIRV